MKLNDYWNTSSTVLFILKLTGIGVFSWWWILFPQLIGWLINLKIRYGIVKKEE